MAYSGWLYELEFNKLCEWYKIPLLHFNLLEMKKQHELMRDFGYKIRHLVIKKPTKEIILGLFKEYGCI